MNWKIDWSNLESLKKNKMETHDWVKFRTIEHKGGGTVDVWRGDCINNPNNPKKSQLQLNAIATYYRLNGNGVWVDGRNFDGDLLKWLQCNQDEKTENIWNAALLKNEG
mgnify:CR=1 FL=1